jgi:hypothetical protein
MVRGFLWLLAGSLALMACGRSESAVEVAAATTVPTGVHSSEGAPSVVGCEPMNVGYPSNSASGNRYVEGASTLPRSDHLQVKLGWNPNWVAAVGSDSGSIWLMSGPGGESMALSVDLKADYTLISPDELTPVSIPALKYESGSARAIGSGIADASRLTYPLWAISAVVYVNRAGDLSNAEGSILLDAVLPDARLTLTSSGSLLVYSEPTERYDHGVLGDRVEAGALTSIEPVSGDVSWIYRPSDEAVLEGLGPIVADLDADLGPEIVITESTSVTGSRYVVLGESGDLVARGDPIGQGYRWQHAIAIAPFGPEGEPELVGVRTPHLRATVEFFRLDGEQLLRVASLPGYTSHELGSRNLDGAVAADFDGDGAAELLLPTLDRRSLAAIGRRGSEAFEEFRLTFGGRPSSNLAVACHGGQGLAVAVGTDNGELNLWLPLLGE